MALLDDQKKQIENELAQKKLSMNQSLATQKLETDNSINRNKQYLDEQINTLNTNRIANDDKITALQNRRGGFYSGGLDYSLAENLRNTTEGQNGLRRDIGTRNSEMLGQYNLKASQAAEQIRLLENESADRIRALVNAALEQQRQAASSRARSSSSRGGSLSRNTSQQPSPVAQQFRNDKANSQQPILDKYYQSQSALLNQGRSLARRKLEDIYPGTIKAPKDNKNLISTGNLNKTFMDMYQRNKLIIDSMRGR
jgi:hypothetical protein